MNVINYIENSTNSVELFESTFDSKLESFYFDNNQWESRAFFYPMRKESVKTIDEAIMISVIQQFVRFGEFSFINISRAEIFKTSTTYLRAHYGDFEFGLNEKRTLNDCLKRVIDEKSVRIYRDENWQTTLKKEEIFELEWTEESSYRCYHLKSDWNDEDYIFETLNYFVRFGWNTSA